MDIRKIAISNGYEQVMDDVLVKDNKAVLISNEHLSIVRYKKNIRKPVKLYSGPIHRYTGRKYDDDNQKMVDWFDELDKALKAFN